MEYKVTVAQGKVVWYKLYNGNTVPVKVSHSLLLMVITIMASCRLL